MCVLFYDRDTQIVRANTPFRLYGFKLISKLNITALYSEIRDKSTREWRYYPNPHGRQIIRNKILLNKSESNVYNYTNSSLVLFPCVLTCLVP